MVPKKLLFCIFFLLSFSAMYPNDTLRVSISDRYVAKIVVNERDDYDTSGKVFIYDTQTNAILIEQESSALPDDEGQSVVNVRQLPYGEQSLIQYDDFNFDGIKDIALKDGNMSCYAGPSYQVYLADGKGGFRYSNEFTDLAQNYCGLFSVDYDAKRIYTMSKSGCCSHWFYTFDVVNNAPRIREEIEESMSFNVPFKINYIMTTWDEKGNKVEKKQDVLNLDNDESVLFSFRLKNKDRKVILIDDDKTLYYVFVKLDEDGDWIIDFNYPYADNEEDLMEQKLTYNVTKSKKNDTEMLTFTNESATYQIYNSKDKVGIKVTTNGKVYDMEGDLSTRTQGHFFDKLEGLIFENLIFDADTRLDSDLDN